MANSFQNKDRRVVPNWRSFEQTTKLGELNSVLVKTQPLYNQIDIESYVFQWVKNRNIISASELISAAFVNGRIDQKVVIDAAKYLLTNPDRSSHSQISLANQLLKRNIQEIQEANLYQNEILDAINPKKIRENIKQIKLHIRYLQRNPILYVELARNYSILGQEEKAIKAMKMALHISPNNRFILRCATRLFLHCDNNGEKDYVNYIHNILKKNPLTAVDPWLLSAELSVSTILNKTSKFIKKGIALINSQNISPFSFTELASGIGTIELLHGTMKKSREYFKKSLISPNDNSLAQIEWASTKDNKIQFNLSSFNVDLNFEALALDHYTNEEFSLAYENSVKWFIDMPFSKRAIMFGSNIASTILKDQEKSIELLKAGLLSHPNDHQIINNLAYALALDNRPEEALNQIKKIRNDVLIDDYSQICLIATKGLAFFRVGQEQIGRAMYLDAIKATQRNKNKELEWVATLNYAREEILKKSNYVESAISLVAKIPNDGVTKSVKILKQEILSMYEKDK